MRRLLLAIAVLIVAGVAATFAVPSARADCGRATPGMLVNDGGPSNNMCFHWADTNRADLTHVNLVREGSNWTTAWLNGANTAVTQWNLVGTMRLAQVPGSSTCHLYGLGGGGNPPAQSGIGPDQITPHIFACVAPLSYICNGLTNWTACTQPWIYPQWDPTTRRYWEGPHFFAIEIDFRTNPTDVGGNPFTPSQLQINQAFCHEIAGHGIGGNHTFSGPPNYTDINPTETQSCLAAANYPDTPTTLGTVVVSDETAWGTAHTDPASVTGLWDIGYKLARKVKRETALHHPTRLTRHKLRVLLAEHPQLIVSLAALGIEPHPIYVTDVELRRAPRGLLPIGYFYVVKLPSDALVTVNRK